MAAVFDSKGREIASEAEVNQFIEDEKNLNNTQETPEGDPVPQDGSSLEDAENGATTANGDTAANGNKANGNYINPAVFDKALLSNHPGYQPVGLNKTPGVGFSRNVYVDGAAALYTGCKFTPHDIPPDPKDPPHTDEIATGCANVFCNGGRMARIGDKMKGKGQIFGGLTKSCFSVNVPSKGLI